MPLFTEAGKPILLPDGQAERHELASETRCDANRFVAVCTCGETFLSDDGRTLAGLAWADHANRSLFSVGRTA